VALLRTEVVSTVPDLDRLEREWDELLEASRQRVFFLRWRWIRAWWIAFAPPRARLLVVACRDEAGRLVGLAPLYAHRPRYYGSVSIREIGFLGTLAGPRTSEYLDVIAREGLEESVGRAVGGFLRVCRHWDRLVLWSVPAQSVVIENVVSSLGGRRTVRHCDWAHVLETTRSWDEVRGTLGHDVERASRSVWASPGGRVVVVQTLAELEPALDDLVRLHQARWRQRGQAGSFADRNVEAFLRLTAREAFERGRLGLWRIMLGDRCVAALIAFVDFGVVHYFQSGYDPASSLPLGRAMVGAAIRDSVLAVGVHTFDFMGGHDSYKEQWTTVVRETVEIECLRTSVRSVQYVGVSAAFRMARRFRDVMRARTRSTSGANR
jgi:CelD/BcsL family acetyltransferase involved in cellulose biosynthesis